MSQMKQPTVASIENAYEIITKDFAYPAGWREYLDGMIVDTNGILYSDCINGRVRRRDPIARNKKYSSYHLMYKKHRFTIRISAKTMATRFTATAAQKQGLLPSMVDTTEVKEVKTNKTTVTNTDKKWAVIARVGENKLDALVYEGFETKEKATIEARNLIGKSAITSVSVVCMDGPNFRRGIVEY